ncbi:MAG TPA: V-type ATP synthase subunit F [Vicinamibacterales bacterium]|nr:V-type ATP synthase subunit F [Vicinamibacterales bacterium]
MSVFVAGTFEDVVGFGLVGAKGAVCETAAEVRAALKAARTDPEVAIVLISAGPSRLAPHDVEAASIAHDAPIVIVLPEVGTNHAAVEGGDAR